MLALKKPSLHLEFGRKTYVMGIVNVTPDSFSDGGLFADSQAAIAHGARLMEEGAYILDIGGESTRPGAALVSEADELARVIPVIETLVNEYGAMVSIDTSKSRVAEAALKAGAVMVNDVTALKGDPRMADIVAAAKAHVILMHMRGTPQTMQKAPRYLDVVAEVVQELQASLKIASQAGIAPDKILVDPGIGFGKTLAHNMDLLQRLMEFKSLLSKPVIVGPSRKAFIGTLLETPIAERDEGTAAVVAFAISQGADIVRVHDVKMMARVSKMTDYLVRIPATVHNERQAES